MAVYLVDASPYIFRAHFALPELTAPDGRPVQAVRGFADFLVRLVREERPDGLGVCFDESLTTSFRNEIDPAYKSNRPLPPPELEAQLATCRELAHAFGAATFSDERYEADDLIATLCSRIEGPVLIVSSDKDLAQLVRADVTLFDFARGTRFGPAEVKKKFGVRPDQIPDLLGLAGDPVDNIAGVQGVGKKTAVALLEVFGHIEALYDRLEEVASLPLRGAKAVRARLDRGRDQAMLSKRLATVATDAPATADGLGYRGADRRRIEALFDRLGFGRRMRDRIEFRG